MDLTRRSLLAQLSTLAGGLVAANLYAQDGSAPQKPGLENRIRNRLKRKSATPAAPSFVYFGTDTTKGGKGLYLSRFNPANGQLTPPMLAATCVRPSWCALGDNPKRRLLYVCNEGDEHNSGVSAYTIDPAGALRFLGQVSSAGAGPVSMAIDESYSSMYIADYSGSSIASYRILPDGTLTQPVEHIDFRNAGFGTQGPNHERQDAPHPHSAVISPSNRFLLINDLGNDTIVTFPIDAATARLGHPHVNQRRPGSGPRHLDFHPNGRWIYCVDELDSHVDQLLFNTTRGDPAHGFEPQALITDTGRSLSTVAPHFHGVNTAAEIAVDPEGRFFYVSNRGEDSLVCFAIDQVTGEPKFSQRISCGGRTPRNFSFDPTGRWLICANQDSNNATVFSCNESNGQLTGPLQTVSVPAPQFTLFA